MLGMGGLFLYAKKPPAVGSIIEMVFDLKVGEVRARAVVRHSCAGKGMGVQFVSMEPSDRARLNQFLSQCPPMATDEAAAAQRCGGATDAESTAEAEKIQFERDFAEKLQQARSGTYYQLLGVTSESPAKAIKQGFYALARKYHPDRHMSKPEWMAPLKDLMESVTAAYNILSDEEKRAIYDEQLESSGAFNLGRSRSVSQKNLEECFLHATESLRAENYAGSIVWLRKCVELAPDEPRYRALLANSLATIPQYRNEAIQHYERAIELDPFNARLLHQFAELFEEMQLASRARQMYLKILEIEPNHARARERLAHCKV
jgi:curved DNA-binding protein CbpA